MSFRDISSPGVHRHVIAPMPISTSITQLWWHEHCFCPDTQRQAGRRAGPSVGSALLPVAVHRSHPHRGRAAASIRRVHQHARLHIAGGPQTGEFGQGDGLMSTGSTSTATTCWFATTTPASWWVVTGCWRRRVPSRPEAFIPRQNSTFVAFDPLRPSLVEMGRAVVRDGHRNGGVVLLMWAGILAYLDRYGYDYVTGCVSVPIGDDADGDVAGQPAARRPRLHPEPPRRTAAVPGAPLPARARRREDHRRHCPAAAAVRFRR